MHPCRICQGPLPDPFLDLGNQPLANNLPLIGDPPPDRFPLALTRCPVCALVQLTYDVPREKLFSHYLYTPSQSQVFHRHFEELAGTLDNASTKVGLHQRSVVDEGLNFEDLIRSLEKQHSQRRPLVIDVGSNDGLLLSKFLALNWRVLGIDPAENLAQKANARGIPTHVGYLDDATAQAVIAAHGPAQIITATNVFAHTPDPRGFLRAARRLLAEDGMLVIEVPALETMIAGGTFDLCYHEHYSSFSLHALDQIAIKEDLHLEGSTFVPIHGGSHRAFFTKRHLATGPAPSRVVGYGGSHRKYSAAASAYPAPSREDCDRFADRVGWVRRGVRSLLAEQRAFGQQVIGYSAPAKATVMANFCGISVKDLDFIVDDSPLKQGRGLPVHDGSIPIRPPEAIAGGLRETCFFIFAWNIADELIKKLPPTSSAIVPFPKPHLRTR